MTDEQIEELLGRYRPSTPHGDVRAHVLMAAGRPRRVTLGAWEFGLAAAAAALVIAALATSAQQPAAPTPAETAWRAEVDQMAALVGGPAARAIAETLVEQPNPLRQSGE